MRGTTGLRAAGVVAAVAALAALPSTGCSGQKESDRMGNAGQESNGSPTVGQGLETATFAAGCFWGVEAAFRGVEGVVSTSVGYTGGHTDQPTYEQVCSDRTGHAEAVQVVFDPKKVSYQRLLDEFWSVHDPTTLNRQGPDVGSQYRSAIFFHSPEQEAAARQSLAGQTASGRFVRPIVTQIVPAAAYWPAEEYHQQYLAKRGQASCASTIRP